jgi:hypothetical protein
MTEPQTFNPPGPLNTAVLFLVFNRPDVTAQVFEAISQAKPPRLYVAADGPRANRPGEAERCAEVRRIATNVDWPCEVKTLFRESNLGCKRAVSDAITWFFENEPQGIILEDDCLPDPTFFRYCEELLERYRYDQRIGMISGDNFQFGRRRNDDSYYFSKYVHIWGWASWRDRWVGSYDVTMAKWPRVRQEGRLADMVGNERETAFWGKNFERVYRGEIDTWDYQWVFANWVEGRSTILPATNLISNIGFDANATHTTSDSELANLPARPLTFPLKHPVGVIRNMQADAYSEKKCFQIPLAKRIRNKLAGLLR